MHAAPCRRFAVPPYGLTVNRDDVSLSSIVEVVGPCTETPLKGLDVNEAKTFLNTS
jgi:hypothetical protein